MILNAMILAATLAGGPATGSPVIAFEGSAVVVRGVTPGGSVVWFSVAREHPHWLTRVVRRDAVLPDSDGDGVVRFELKEPVPRRSIWTAVDLTTGAYATATPQDVARLEVHPAADSLRRSPLGVVEALQDARGFLEILLVRPGQGAWAQSVGDGGASDSSGLPDGRVQASFASMRPIESSKAAPGQLAPGDVVIGVDPESLEFYGTRVGATP